MENVVEIEIRGNTTNLQKAGNEAKIYARDTKKELEKSLLLNLEINVAQFQSKLEDARKRLAQAKKEGEKDSTIQLRVETNKLQSSLTEAKRQLNNYVNTGDKDLSRLQSKFDGLGNGVKNTFTKIGAAFVGLFAFDKIKNGLISIGKISMEFESALAGVNKTLDVTPGQLSKIDNGLKALSTRIPIAYTELAKIAETGGQLGVGAEDILKFTETVAKIGVTTNLTSEEAATNFARISNVIKEPLGNIDKLASSVVELGNNFAANEQEILNFATNIAGAGSIAGLSAGDIFGIATAFTSIGIEAEAGGTAVQKAILAINTAVATGGSKLGQFAELSGKTREQFIGDWKADAGKTFADFVSQIGAAGDKGVLVLNELIGTDVRLQRAFLGLAQNSKLLTDAINTGNRAYEENNALQDEANKRFATSESQLTLQANKWKIFGDYLGKQFLPIFIQLTDFFTTELPIGLIKIQNGLLILIGKFIQFGIAVGGAISTIPDRFSILVNDISATIAIGINGWIGYFQGFVGGAGKAFNNLKEFIGAAIGNIGPLIGKGLNKASKPIEDFFNGFIEAYNSTIGKIGPSINGKVDFSIDFGDTKELPSLTKGVKEEFNKIKGEYNDLGGVILQNNISRNRAYSDNIKNIQENAKKEIGIIEDSNNFFALEGQKQIELLKGNADTALGITKDKIKGEIQEEQNAIKDFLDSLDDKTGGAKKQADDSMKIKEKELEEKARLEILAIKGSELNELQKAKSIVEINKKLQRDLKELKGDGIKNEIEDANEIIKIAEENEKKRLKTVEDFYEAIDKKLGNSEKNIESYKKKVGELNKEFEKLKTDAIKNIQDINYEISKGSEETEIKLAERILEALNEQEEAQKRLNELKREGVEYVARQFEGNQETLKGMETSGVEEIGGIPIKDITEYLSLLEKQKQLQEEITLATKNSSEEIRNEAKRVSELSETEKILEDQRKNEAILEERKKIYEAIRDGEIIILDEIQNYENQKLAEQLIAKQTELDAELELAKQGLEAEKQGIIELYEEKKRIEKEYTNFFMGEIDKKVTAVRKLASEYKAVMSDIAQTKAGQVINNNTTTNVGGITANNNVDLELIFSKLNF